MLAISSLGTEKKNLRPFLRLHDSAGLSSLVPPHYRMDEILDIESSRINEPPDYVSLSGILIFVALMCFCIVLLANGAKRSVAILEQTAVSKVSDATARLLLPPDAPGEAQVSARIGHYSARASLYCSYFSIEPILGRSF